MDFGQLVFLNANFYERDGSPRCYAQFCNPRTGEVMSFDARVWRTTDKPDLFSICDVKGEMRQYGKSVSFILTDCKVVGRLEVVKK